jgi:hypothetical protein
MPVGIIVDWVSIASRLAPIRGLVVTQGASDRHRLQRRFKKAEGSLFRTLGRFEERQVTAVALYVQHGIVDGFGNALGATDVGG